MTKGHVKLRPYLSTGSILLTSSGWLRDCVGPEGKIFAADFHNHRMQVFSASGRFLTSFDRFGHGAGEFDHLIAIAVTVTGDSFTTASGGS